MSDQTERWEHYDEKRQEIEADLTEAPPIPNRLLRMSGIHTSLPKDGQVFDYPDSVYYKVSGDLLEYADTIDEAIRNHVDVTDKWELTGRTDGRVDEIYWVLES